MIIDKITDLEKLWDYTNQLHNKLYPSSRLALITAGGKLYKPKYMFVFINPTHRNVSSDPVWQGKRRPWTGTKYIWKIFANAGHFDASLLKEISARKTWDVSFADKVYDHLAERGFYFTNIVKWTGENADLPDKKKIGEFLPILLKEIEIVKPQNIITFGLIPFNALLGSNIKLGDYYAESMSSKKLSRFPIKAGTYSSSVIPCYFPVGRGNPKRATELLSLLT